MHYKAALVSALVSALALPSSAAAHRGPHTAMGLLETIEHMLGPGHVIGLAIAVTAAAVMAFWGIGSPRSGRNTHRNKNAGKAGR